MIALLDTTNEIAGLLRPKLNERLPQTVLEIFSSQPALRQRLCQLDEARVLTILAADTPEQLLKFRELRHVFADVPIVLILPDAAPETIRLGHRLYPRFVSTRWCNLDDLVMVVARMNAIVQ